ncbi:MAG: hypothetical protein WCW14_02460 [Candidatus Paceibacterota bacterium]|jgi:hypothetical protein
MSKELKNITDNIMDQIHEQKIKMRPRVYFIAGSIFTFMGLVSSVVISVFLVGLIRFSLRTHGPMASYRLDQILSSFPWWVPIFAIIGLVIGIWLLRKYDFSFKINFKMVIVSFILAIIIGGFVIDSIGLNDALMRRRPMQGIMRQYMQDNNIQGVQGDGQGWSRKSDN